MQPDEKYIADSQKLTGDENKVIIQKDVTNYDAIIGRHLLVKISNVFEEIEFIFRYHANLAIIPPSTNRLSF